MNEQQIKEKIKEVLGAYKLAVISTVDENNKPESALVAFAERDDLSFVFGTSNETRKYKNLQTNPHVSFVIGWGDTAGCVQYEGVARELSYDDGLIQGSFLASKNEGAEKFIVRDTQRYFAVRPTWIRLIDTGSGTEGDLEISFSS